MSKRRPRYEPARDFYTRAQPPPPTVFLTEHVQTDHQRRQDQTVERLRAALKEKR